ncbi:MAG: FecR domain-containing protein [Verrucomicrobia bacterium]|nr:FecR domain-containing protein [Verrucomicrobiota bacterium]MDE3099123.1 FecR domain-containing protein [Verrucomicrobiota bacterium]
MKLTKTFAFTVLCGVLFSAVAAMAQSTPGYATIVRITGEARYSNDGQHWHALVIGARLSPGDVIQTSADGTVDMVLGHKISHHISAAPGPIGLAPDPNVLGYVSYKAVASQNVIHMQSGTVLAIDKLTIADTGVDAVSDTELDLRQGTIFGSVKKLSAESQYLIKFPTGIAGVRGTIFKMSANGAITVVSGSMVLSCTTANGQTVTVVLGRGDSFNPETRRTTHLTPLQLSAVEKMGKAYVTSWQGIITFADDRTLIRISPTGQNGQGQNNNNQ